MSFSKSLDVDLDGLKILILPDDRNGWAEFVSERDRDCQCLSHKHDTLDDDIDKVDWTLQ